MPGASAHEEFGKIDGTYPDLDDPDQLLINYVSFRLATYLSYSTHDDDIQAIPQMISRSENHVRDLPTDVLRTRDNDQSTLELATREWTGYGTPQDRDSALEKWTFLASESAVTVPRRIKAQAHSCLAACWFDRGTENSERWNIDSLYRAGNNANEAISLGLLSPAALRAGFLIEDQGLRRPEDNRSTGVNTDRFERLDDLWEAIDTRVTEVKKAAVKKDAKVPLKYMCAADDCGIQATKKTGLFRCAGKCPVVYKPSYCSKECQKVDWRRHKPFCKSDATKSSVPSLNASDDADEETVRLASRPEDTHDIDVRMKRGVTIRIHCRALGPHMMRELRKVS